MDVPRAITHQEVEAEVEVQEEEHEDPNKGALVIRKALARDEDKWIASEIMPMGYVGREEWESCHKMLCETVSMTDILPYLRQYNVINHSMEESMMHNGTRKDQVQFLIHFLGGKPRWMWHAFLKSLVETRQEHVLYNMNLTPDHYMQECSAEIKGDMLRQKGNDNFVEPWDQRCRENQGILQYDEAYGRMIQSRRVFLTGNVHMADLWPYLRQFDVIDSVKEEELKLVKGNSNQVQEFLDFLLRNPVWRFHAFLLALVQTNQDHILDGLNINVSMYSQLDPLANIVEAELDDACLKVLKGHYLHCASNFDVMKYVLRSPKIDVQRVYVKLLLMEQDDRVVAGARAGDERIRENQVFDKVAFNTLIEGDPGAGKTFLAVNQILAWVQQDPDYVLSQKRLIIFVQPREVRDSLDSTVKAALKGTLPMRQKMFRFWKFHPELCCIVFDGLDEICNETALLKDLFDFMSNKACFFIVTCRTNSTVLDERRDYFQRWIKVVGFDKDDAICFIKRFLTSDDGLLSGSGIALTRALKTNGGLLGLFCNPMVACLTCLLVTESVVRAENLNKLSLVNLYQKVEELLLLRDGTEITDSVNKEVEKLHQLALWSLLVNKVSYTQEDLENFDISATSGIVGILLRKGQGTAWGSFKPVFYWIHRSFHEFSAAMAFKTCTGSIRKLLICYVASKRELNHLAYMLACLFQDDSEFVEILVKATLTYQTALFEEDMCSFKCSRKARKYLNDLDAQNLILGKMPHGCPPEIDHPSEMEPCECNHVDMRNETTLQSFYQASKYILCAAPEVCNVLSNRTLDMFTPAIIHQETTGTLRLIQVPGTVRFVLIADRHVIWNEYYISAVYARDIINADIFNYSWTPPYSSKLEGIVFDFTDVGMSPTQLLHSPTKEELQDLMDYIIRSSKLGLTGRASIGFMYPPKGCLNSLIDILYPEMLEELYRCGFHSLFIWDGRVFTKKVYTWLHTLEQSFQCTKFTEYLGDWLCITHKWRLQGKFSMKICFYGVTFLESSQYKSYVEGLGFLQHCHWE